VPDIIADYHQSSLGTWRVGLSVDGDELEVAQAANIQEAVLAALGRIQQIVDGHGEPGSTIHTLDGDVQAFAELAAAENLGECAAQGGSAAMLTWEEAPSELP